MKWLIIKAGGVVLCVFLFGLIGVVVGADIGGNYPDVRVFGIGGYEDLGGLGLATGVVVGAILGLLMKPRKWW